MQVFAGTRPLDARFEVETVEGATTIIWRSRSGGGTVRNSDYNEALELVLARLRALGATLDTAVVDSEHTRRAGLPFEERVLDPGQGRAFPVALDTVGDIAALRGALGASQGGVGRRPGATGSGNYTKQIRLYLSFGGPEPSPAALERILAFGSRVLIVALPWSARRNLERGLDNGIWGFPVPRFEAVETERLAGYKLLQRGDVVLLLFGYTGGSPRAPVASWLRAADGTPHEFSECYRCTVNRPYFHDPTPFWPDEIAVGESRYPHRIGIDPTEIGAVSLEPGSDLSEEAIKAVRRSHLQGAQGFIVDAGGSPLLSDGQLVATGPPGAAPPSASPPSRGEGRSVDPIRRKRVEDHAMALARRHYESDGWSVEDVSRQNEETEGTPYDLRCTKTSMTRHVEVKGLSGSAETVSLTANERTHAETQLKAESYLFVVEQIGLKTVKGEVVAEGGTIRYHGPFDTDPSRFVPTQYRYLVPAPPGANTSTGQ